MCGAHNFTPLSMFDQWKLRLHHQGSVTILKVISLTRIVILNGNRFSCCMRRSSLKKIACPPHPPIDWLKTLTTKKLFFYVFCTINLKKLILKKISCQSTDLIFFHLESGEGKQALFYENIYKLTTFIYVRKFKKKNKLKKEVFMDGYTKYVINIYVR